MSNAVSRQTVALVIPALNESESIAAVVAAVRSYGQPIVVDDGSSDGTGSLASAAGAVVVTHAENRGYDLALESGLTRAIDDGYDFVVTLDADGQHNPELLAPVLAQLFAGADMVVGVRDRHQRFSESAFSITAKLLWGIADPLCGMKGYRIAKLGAIPEFCTYTSVGTELALRAARSGWRIAQVPINTSSRKGASRFGTGLRANWMILKALALGLFLARSFPMQAPVKA
jgi:hypothetical protein